MVKDKNYISKGKMTFRYSKSKGLESFIAEKEKYLKIYNGEDFMHEFEHYVGSLMSGKEFYDNVDSGCIIDYDGSISDIFVDEYISNLGLAHKGLCQGKLLLDGEAFLDLCNSHKVEVNWCNK